MVSTRRSNLLFVVCCWTVLGAWNTAAFAPCQIRPLTTAAAKSQSTLFSSHPHKQPDKSAGNPFFKWLATLSLEDYQWRVNVFKNNQADRMVEESLARMRGENATYFRPMDADGANLGPLGRLESWLVDTIFKIIQEEGRRATLIIENAGRLIRPSDNDEMGPLGYLEVQVVDIFDRIRNSERLRAKTKTLRPMDLNVRDRGPLGDLELTAVGIFQQIKQSEELRGQQISLRNELVRPIDVPGPLGELESRVAEIIRAEKLRSQQKIVRPKDANYKGPLGDLESNAYAFIDSLNRSELQRLESIRQYLYENRPMDVARDSLLGSVEALLVGLLRAPRLLASVVERVKELMEAEPVSVGDQALLDEQSSLPPQSDKKDV